MEHVPPGEPGLAPPKPKNAGRISSGQGRVFRGNLQGSNKLHAKVLHNFSTAGLKAQKRKNAEGLNPCGSAPSGGILPLQSHPTPRLTWLTCCCASGPTKIKTVCLGWHVMGLSWRGAFIRTQRAENRKQLR